MEVRQGRKVPYRKQAIGWKPGIAGEYHTGSKQQDEGQTEEENAVQKANRMMKDRRRRRISCRKQVTGRRAAGKENTIE
jgi:hypothetical protein